MRQPLYLKKQGRFWYYRLNSESGLVDQDEDTWRATGCTNRIAAEQVLVELIGQGVDTLE
jgi:hypothetical protein